MLESSIPLIILMGVFLLGILCCFLLFFMCGESINTLTNKYNVIKPTVVKSDEYKTTSNCCNVAQDIIWYNVVSNIHEKGGGLYADRYQIYGVLQQEINKLTTTLDSQDATAFTKGINSLAVECVKSLASVIEKEETP